MKRISALMLIITLVVSLAACSGPQTDTLDETPPQQEVTVAPLQPEVPETVDPLEPDTSTSEPQREPYKLTDIFSEEFNPFGMDSGPFTVAEASFNKREKPEGENEFRLIMTGGGNMLDCIAYQADAAGLGLDEAGKLKLLDDLVANGSLWFCVQGGPVYTGRWADPNDGRYEYVEADGSHGISGPGCVFEPIYSVPDEELEKYTQLVRDNFNMEALSMISEYMDIETDFSECGIAVNLYTDMAYVSVTYHVSDIDAIMQSLTENLECEWWEAWGRTETGIGYNEQISNLLAVDKGKGTITITQMISNISRP